MQSLDFLSKFNHCDFQCLLPQLKKLVTFNFIQMLLPFSMRGQGNLARAFHITDFTSYFWIISPSRFLSILGLEFWLINVLLFQFFFGVITFQLLWNRLILCLQSNLHLLVFAPLQVWIQGFLARCCYMAQSASPLLLNFLMCKNLRKLSNTLLFHHYSISFQHGCWSIFTFHKFRYHRNILQCSRWSYHIYLVKMCCQNFS